MFGVERRVAVFPGEPRLASCIGGECCGHEHERVAGMLLHTGQGQDRLDRKGQRVAGLAGNHAGRFQQSDREVEIVGVDRVGERGEDVLRVGGHTSTPRELLRRPQSFVAAEGVLGVVAGVAVAERVGLDVFHEAFLAVLADRFQQPIPGVDTTAFGDHQRTGHQVGEQPQHGTSLDRRARTDRFRRVANATSREHGQADQESLLPLVEQVIGPVDRCPQRLLTFHRPPPAPRQEVEASIQRGGQLRRAHRRHPRRSQLDRQWHPIEATTHLTHCGPVRSTEHEVGVRGPGTLHEQLHRVGCAHRLQVGVRGGSRQRRHREHSLPLEGQTLSARRQHHHPWARTGDLLDQVSDRVQNVLTVVDHQQQLLRLEELRQGLHQRLARRGRSPRTPPRTRRPPRRDHAPPPTR